MAKLVKELGPSDKIESELSVMRLPQWLGHTVKLTESELTKLKFDIASKSKDNLIFCELKMKVYSGCTAGRIELMEKFNKFTKLIIGNPTLRSCLKDAGIKNVFLIGGVLFDIQGQPATVQKDEEWGICYGGLIRGKNDILRTLEDKMVRHRTGGEESEKAFVIDYDVDGIKVNIIAVYGNEVINSLFLGKQQHDIQYFRKQLEDMLYDDLWLGQIITLSERAVLNQNFKKNKNLNNYVISILKNADMLSELTKFQLSRDAETLKKVASRIIELIGNYDKKLLDIGPTPAETIITSSGQDYHRQDYAADIVQFLTCRNLLDSLR